MGTQQLTKSFPWQSHSFDEIRVEGWTVVVFIKHVHELRRPLCTHLKLEKKKKTDCVIWNLKKKIFSTPRSHVCLIKK